MRLLHLWIEKYKNLKDFTIDFEKGDGLTMLIGTNGSGKSNIIEAISAIFFAAYRAAYRNNKKNALGCDYLMCFSVGEKIIYIASYKNKCTIAKIISHDGSGNAPVFVEVEKGAAQNFARIICSKQKQIDAEGVLFSINRIQKADEHLPNNIIAIYSGEETRLWDEVYQHPYKQYLSNARRGISNNDLHMTYISKSHWEIALFILWFSSTPSNDEYLRNEIGIHSIDEIEFTLAREHISVANNPLLTAFFERLLPGEEKTIVLTEDQIRERLCDRGVFHLVGKPTINEDGKTSLPLQFNNTLYTDIRDIFQFLIQACDLKSNRIIQRMDIKFNGGLNTHSLSEGEKKLLLIKCALDIGANQDSLLLFDEPDAFIHEMRKRDLLVMMKEYTQYGRQIVLTSHSPTLANAYNSEGHIMLEKDEYGYVRKIPHEDVKAVELLTGGIWTAVEQNIFFSSVKTLILVEGIGDIKYIEKAIEVLAPANEEYKKLNCDFLQMGGAGENARQFIDRLSPYVNSSRTVIILFDRDDEGSKGMKACVGVGNDRERDYGVYRKGNWHYLMLPKTAEHSYIDFLIEDYFSKDMKNTIAQGFLDKADGHFKILPKDIKDSVKKDLEKNIGEYDSVAMMGFTTLLNKLVAIIDGSEPVENVI